MYILVGLSAVPGSDHAKSSPKHTVVGLNCSFVKPYFSIQKMLGKVPRFAGTYELKGANP
jgi:hypothetical protein